jgi:hypothetical protein
VQQIFGTADTEDAAGVVNDREVAGYEAAFHVVLPLDWFVRVVDKACRRLLGVWSGCTRPEFHGMLLLQLVNTVVCTCDDLKRALQIKE